MISRAIHLDDDLDRPGLDVVPDEDAEEQQPPRHANIVGTPYREDDPGAAEFFARRLVEAAGKPIAI